MQTDRRETPRVQLERDVVINANKSEPQFCAIRDISPEGVFVETAGRPLISTGKVQIAISLPVGNSQKLYHLPAKVMRVTEEGAGLRFDELGVDSYGAILGLMVVA